MTSAFVRLNSPGIVSAESQHNVAIVWHGNCVFERWAFELSMKQAPSIQVESMLQANLLDGGVWWSTHADDIERMTVQMEWMAQVVLLDFVD